MQTRVKGTLILRRHRRFFKVITLRGLGNNRYSFECKDIETRQSRVLEFEMLGLLEAMDHAASVMKNPQDVLLMDLDNQGKWKIVTKEQIAVIMGKH